MPNKTIADFLQDPDTYATVACAILLDRFGTEFLSWDPKALAMSVHQHCGVSLHPVVDDKVQAASVILTTNLFETSLETYTTVCNALNGRHVSGVQFIPATLEDCLWGTMEAGLLQGKVYSGSDMSDDIARYCGVVLAAEGVYDAPGVLRWAQYPDDNNPDRAQASFSDDVEYAAYRDHQSDQKSDLELYGYQHLQEMFLQMQDLPMRDVDPRYVKDMLAKIKAQIARTA